MFLLINTALNDRIIIALINPSKRGNLILAKMNLKARFQQSEKLLPAIAKLLEQNKTNLKKLEGIIVASGPGSFTSLRIGIAVANTLGYVQQIPVVEVKLTDLKKENDLTEIAEQGIKKLKKVKKFKIVLPFYGKEPNITMAKK